jgi:hypothetical protein
VLESWIVTIVVLLVRISEKEKMSSGSKGGSGAGGAGIMSVLGRIGVVMVNEITHAMIIKVGAYIFMFECCQFGIDFLNLYRSIPIYIMISARMTW